MADFFMVLLVLVLMVMVVLMLVRLVRLVVERKLLGWTAAGQMVMLIATTDTAAAATRTIIMMLQRLLLLLLLVVLLQRGGQHHGGRLVRQYRWLGVDGGGRRLHGHNGTVIERIELALELVDEGGRTDGLAWHGGGGRGGA